MITSANCFAGTPPPPSYTQCAQALPQLTTATSPTSRQGNCHSHAQTIANANYLFPAADCPFRSRFCHTPPNCRTPESSYANALQAIAILTLPFHPPSTTVVFARHPGIQDQLHNWRKAHRTWQPNHSPPCTCQQLKQRHPTHNIHHDHVVIPLHALAPDPHFLQYSGRSTFFPPGKPLRQSLVQAIHRWHKQHHLPIPQKDDDTIQHFVSQQMALHQQHQQQTLNLRVVKNATSHIPTGVVHCEDHFPNRLMWYCPQSTLMQSAQRSWANQFSTNYTHSPSHTTSTPTTTSRNYYLNTSWPSRNGAGFPQPTSSPKPKSSMQRADPSFPLLGP